MKETDKVGLRRIVAALCVVAVCGCSRIGASKFYEDQLGYTRALGEGEKSATLLNVVRIRYGDAPTFLEPTQVISGYQLQQTVMGGFEAFPAANPSSFVSGGVAGQMQESPTFTFQPLSGEQFAHSFIRPLSSADLMPLAMSGMPIDVLFRLGVQSVNQYSNAIALTQTDSAGSPEFFRLLYDLRRLQIAEVLNVRLSQTRTVDGVENVAPPATSPPASPAPGSSTTASSAQGSPPTAAPSHPEPPPHGSGVRGVSALPPYVYLSFTPTSDPALVAIANEAKQLLSIPLDATEAEVVYGRTAGPGQVGVITRSVLGIMSQIAIQIDVPPEDVAKHRTLPTVGNVGLERRPVVIVHCAKDIPTHVFATVKYGGNQFWIDDEDFDSKLAFTVLRVLLALARSGNGPSALVTVPAH